MHLPGDPEWSQSVTFSFADSDLFLPANEQVQGMVLAGMLGVARQLPCLLVADEHARRTPEMLNLTVRAASGVSIECLKVEICRLWRCFVASESNAYFSLEDTSTGIEFRFVLFHGAGEFVTGLFSIEFNFDPQGIERGLAA